MRSAAEVQRVRDMAAAEIGSSEIARVTGLPRSTVRDWLRDPGYRPGRAGGRRVTPLHPSSLPQPAYAYLLGLYLGDGYLVQTGRSFCLRIKLDAGYPGIVGRAAAAVRAVLPAAAVAVRPHAGERSVTVSASSVHWAELLPQHGRGRKHLRTIRLTSWQRAITGPQASALVRGLIHSDGCRYTATVRRHGREYRYARYAFANRSEDIKGILCQHLDLLGIGWTRPNDKDIAVARRADVERMDRFVGPKR